MTNNGLIAEFLLTGNANDTGAGKHHGVVSGATLTSDRFGNANSAFHFDGVDDYITIDPPPPIDNNAMSLSVWVRYGTRELDEWTNCIIAQDDGNDDDQSRRVFQLSTYQGRIVWHRMVGARDPMCKRPIRIGTWFHVVAIHENGEHRIYLDGELHDRVRHRFWTHSSQPIHIGRKGTDEPHFFFSGDIDDIRIYNRVLRPDEIRALLEEGGWRPATTTSSPNPADPVSGRWGRFGVIFLDLQYDGARTVHGRIMARDPGHMAPITNGTFERESGGLRLEGTADHPDNGSPVPYVIEGKLADGELTVVATFDLKPQGHSGNYILTREGARGGWWKNSAIRWRLRKLSRRFR